MKDFMETVRGGKKAIRKEKRKKKEQNIIHNTSVPEFVKEML